MSSLVLAETTTTIKLGVSNATEGPAARLGTDLNAGAELFFSSLEFSQTLPFHQVQLVKYNDSYEPDLTVFNTRNLVNKHVTALFNYVGTPTSSAIMGIVNNREIPFITPFTGADFLHRYSAQHVYNVRSSYEQEANAQIDYLVNELKLKRIGILIQADEFGLAFEKYHLQALAKHGMSPVTITRFKRNSTDIKPAKNKLLANNVEAVLFVGTYQPLNVLIREMAKVNSHPIFATVSFISSDVLTQIMPKDTKLLVSEVLPNPYQCSFKLCEEFVAEVKKAGWVHANRVHFEGFINAKYFTLAAAQCSKQVTRECLKLALENVELDFGSKQRFIKERRQMFNEVYLNLVNLP